MCRLIVKRRVPVAHCTSATQPPVQVYAPLRPYNATTAILVPLIRVLKVLVVSMSHSNALKLQTALPWSVWATMALADHCAIPLLLSIATTRILAPWMSVRKDWDAFTCRIDVSRRPSAIILLAATVQAPIQFVF